MRSGSYGAVTFFSFPEIVAEHAQLAVEAPIDGFMMAYMIVSEQNPIVVSGLTLDERRGLATKRRRCLTAGLAHCEGAGGCASWGRAHLAVESASVFGHLVDIRKFCGDPGGRRLTRV